eukprot:4523084-Prymnesium_polylepis.1
MKSPSRASPGTPRAKMATLDLTTDRQAPTQHDTQPPAGASCGGGSRCPRATAGRGVLLSSDAVA